MKEVELLLWFENLRETQPEFYGAVWGFAIGFAFAGLIIVCIVLYDLIKFKRNVKAEKALDLLGKSVSYKTETFSAIGRVASVDFDLDDSENVEVTIYLDVEDMYGYYKVNYKEFNKRLFLKGDNNEHTD